MLKFNYKNLLIGLTLSAVLTGTAISATLPLQIEQYLKSFNNVNIRFDGLIQFDEGTEYLPVFPLSYKETNTPQKIVKTLPANKTIQQRPDLILFDNNFALLKIIRKKGEKPTLLDDSDIPLIVKMGILPQDLIVPEELVIPEELRVILGDLKIPIKNWAKNFEYKDENAKIVSMLKTKKIIPVNKNIDYRLKDFANSLFYTSSNESNFLHVINPETGRPVKLVKLASTPSDIKLVSEERYILASCMAANKISIIDTLTNKYVKDIDTGKYPSSIAVDNNEIYAYVLNKQSATISVIDILNMVKLKDINTGGYPDNLIISSDNESLYYNDRVNGNIYAVNITVDEPALQQVSKLRNVSRLIENNNVLYAISRTDNVLKVIDLKENKEITTVTTDTKPVDLKIFNGKIYILSAENKTVTVLNEKTFEQEAKITLKGNGFPAKMFIMPAKQKLLISDINSYELELIDLKTNTNVCIIPTSHNINSLIITQSTK